MRIVFVRGMLSREPDPFCVSYPQIKDAIAEGLDAGDDIQLDIDSHGGDSIGVKALADYIFEHREKIIAYVSGVCASAAYYIAAATSHISAAEDAIVGSVGTIGWPPEIGDAKVATLSPLKNSGEDLQAILDDSCERFLRDVARYRGFSGELSELSKQVGAGAMLTARDALSHQLIDEVKTMDDEIDRNELDAEGVAAMLPKLVEQMNRMEAKIDSADERVGLLEQRLDELKKVDEEEAPAAECEEEVKSAEGDEEQPAAENDEEKEEIMACLLSVLRADGRIRAKEEDAARKLQKKDFGLFKAIYVESDRDIVTPVKMSLSSKTHAPVAKTRHEKTLQRMLATGEDYAHALAYCIGKENR